MTALLFAGEDYEARGGWGDLEGSYPSVEEAKARVDSSYRLERQGAGYVNPQMTPAWDFDWAHIVVDGSIVATFHQSCGWVS